MESKDKLKEINIKYRTCYCFYDMNLSNIVTLNIEGYDYCCIISLFSKNEATNLMQNARSLEMQNVWGY